MAPKLCFVAAIFEKSLLIETQIGFR